MTREPTLSQLTAELTDFLDLPESLDLPPLHSVDCRRTSNTPWRVKAFLDGPTNDARYKAICEWAAFAGGTVEVGRPYAAAHQPSGMQRTLTCRVVVAQVPIELTACVDGLFTVPQPRAESTVAAC